ncbi:MAG TPA: hypothetical protein VD794_02940 [Flavisolibacter sp.]|nr:hypothetical protein [Flavisolibacter sp.]
MKNTLPILFFSLLLLLGIHCMGQTYNIINAQAYVRTRTAGNIQTNETGAPLNKGVTKEFLIYLETKGSTLPQWETAYIDGLPYTIRTVEVTQSPVNLGPLKGQKSTVTITKGSTNRLWQLALTPQEPTTARQPAGGTQAIILSGTYRKKNINYRIAKVQELAKRFNP